MEREAVRLEGLPASPVSVLACGAEMKGGLSLFCEGLLHRSGDHGDLSDPAGLGRFLADARGLCRRAGSDPDIVAHDLHPACYSRAAAELFPGARRVAVQHHHAHVAAALAGRADGGEVIGVAFDGSGYGTDGTVWGGEFLSVSPGGWGRRGGLGRLRMPGGDAAAREPWRMGISLLHAVMGEAAFDAPLPPSRRAAAFRPALSAMLATGAFSPLTSSCGRLFDAVAAILGIAPEAQAEAEAAVELERRASLSHDRAAYRIAMRRGRGCFRADYADLVRGLIADIGRGLPVEVMARRFHNGIAEYVARGAVEIRRTRGCRAVALCGGAFGNRLLRGEAARLLSAAGFEPVEEERVPIDDLGLCVGQTWVALRPAAWKEM